MTPGRERSQLRPERTPVRSVSAVLGFLAAGLGEMWIYYSVRYAVTGAALPEGVLVQPASVLRLGFPGATAYDPQEPFIVAAIVAAAGVLLANLRRACQDDAATPLPVPS